MLSWLWDNLGSLVLALVLAITVWVAAVSAEDPVLERTFPAQIPIEQRDLPAGLLIVGEAPRDAQITLRAPSSIWESLTVSDIQLWVDLAGLEAGTHTLRVQAATQSTPSQIVSVSPARITLQIEPAASRQIAIRALLTGEPAIGFRVNAARVSPAEAVVEGPASAVTQIDRLQAEIDLSGRRQSVSQSILLVPVDANGNVVRGVKVEPESASLTVTIEALGGYRSVVVNPRIVDEVEAGYQPTKITVSPTFVTVFSSDPEAISQLGGFVETETISLAGATEDLERRVSLDLPQGVSVVGDPTVVVRVTIAPIESFLTLSIPLNIQGLESGLFALPSPTSVSVILNGPLPILEQLEAVDVQVVLDLVSLGVGKHQITLEPANFIVPEDVTVQSILPDSIEVTVTRNPPPTPSPTPALTPAP